MDKNSTYPELYYSSQILAILTSIPDLPEAPEMPIKPRKPEFPEEYNSGYTRGCSFILFIFGIVFFCISLSAVNIGGILVSIASVFFAYLLFDKVLNDENNFENKKINYKRSSDAYPRELKKYEQEKSEYDIKKSLYDTTVSQLTSSSNLQKFRKRRINTYLSNRTKPLFERCNQSDAVKKGASEDFFISILKQSTEWEILADMRIPVGDKYYYPDIIVVISNIYIDVEIDEPYAGNDGSPIHYLISPFGIGLESVDKNRNEYFAQHGWVVVRFSEEQIFQYTEGCLVYLYQLAENIENGIAGVAVDGNFKKKKWTKEQSHQMAYKRFRRSYIPLQYQSNIDNEEIKEEIFSESDLPF